MNIFNFLVFSLSTTTSWTGAVESMLLRLWLGDETDLWLRESGAVCAGNPWGGLLLLGIQPPPLPMWYKFQVKSRIPFWGYQLFLPRCKIFLFLFKKRFNLYWGSFKQISEVTKMVNSSWAWASSNMDWLENGFMQWRAKSVLDINWFAGAAITEDVLQKQRWSQF